MSAGTGERTPPGPAASAGLCRGREVEIAVPESQYPDYTAKPRPAAQDPAPAGSSARRKARNRCRHVLLVEKQPTLKSALESCGDDRHPVRVVYAASINEARSYLAGHKVDLAVVAPELPDGSGLDLAGELHHAKKPTTTMVVSDTPDFDAATAAMRAGACDFVVTPLDNEKLQVRVQGALQRRHKDMAVNRRIRRLKRLCRKLNDARIDVSKQVDILCTDLVTAYQELAAQFQNAVQTTEFKGVVEEELDLEQLLRKTLEYLVAKAGPSNAAIFLPATMDEYSLGGYVNYDCTSDSADMLLDHLADVVAPRLAGVEDYIHFTSNGELKDWFGDDAAYLEDSEVIGVPCVSGEGDDQECLAVIVLFRDRDQPFSEVALEACSSMGGIMGEALEKVIKVHHRMAIHDDDGWDDGSGPDEPFFDDPYSSDGDDGTLPF